MMAYKMSMFLIINLFGSLSLSNCVHGILELRYDSFVPHKIHSNCKHYNEYNDPQVHSSCMFTKKGENDQFTFQKKF